MKTERKVLIIDDDVDFQLMVSTMLENKGYRVKSLVEGKLQLTTSLARDCDVIMLDIELPGINGLEIGKHLKSSPETSNIPILVVSSHSQSDEVLLGSVADGFVQKPFSLSILACKISELIDKKRDPELKSAVDESS